MDGKRAVLVQLFFSLISSGPLVGKQHSCEFHGAHVQGHLLHHFEKRHKWHTVMDPLHQVHDPPGITRRQRGLAVYVWEGPAGRGRWPLQLPQIVLHLPSVPFKNPLSQPSKCRAQWIFTYVCICVTTTQIKTENIPAP